MASVIAGRLRALFERSRVRWLAGLTVLLLVAWGVLASGFGMGVVVPWAIARSLPEGWTVEVGSVSGDWRSRVAVEGLALRAPDLEADVEAVDVRFRLLPLLRRTIAIDDLTVRNPTATVVVASDRDEERDAEPAGSGPLAFLRQSPLGAWTLEIERARAGEGRAEILVDGSRYDVAGARIGLRGRIAPESVQLELDSLVADVDAPPDPTVSASGVLALAGSVEDGLLSVRRLSFRSERSDLEGSGTMALSADRLFEDAHFTLRADPLDLRDLPIALPPELREAPLARVDLVSRGTVDSLRVEGRMVGPGALEVDSEATIRNLIAESDSTVESPALQATVDISGLRPDSWSTAPPELGVLAANLRVTLEELNGEGPFTLEGSVERTPPSGAPADLTGAPIRSAVTVRRAAADTTGANPIELVAELQRQAGARGWLALGEVEVSVVDSTATWRLSARLDSARATGRGRVSWGSVPSLAVERLEVARLNARRLRSQLPRSSVSGTLRGSVAGSAPESASGSVELRLRPSMAAEVTIDTVAIDARMVDGVSSGRALTLLRGYSIAAGFEARLRSDGFRLLVDTARVTSLPSEGDSVEGTRVRVDGSGSLEWSSEGGIPVAELVASLDSSLVGPVRLAGAEVRLDRTGERTTGTVTAELTDPTGEAVRTSGELAITGSAAAELEGTVEVTAVRASRATDTDTSGSDAPEGADLDTLRISVRADQPGQFDLTGFLRPAEGGLVTLEGSTRADVTEQPIALTALGSLPNPVRLLQGATADSVRIDFSGVRTPDAWQEALAVVAVTGASWRDIGADSLRAVIRSSQGGIRLDTVRVASNVLAIDGEGRLPRAGSPADSITVTAVLLDVEPLRSAIGAEVLAAGEGRWSATLAGTTESARLTSSASLVGAVVDDVRVTGMRATASAEIGLSGDQPGVTDGRVELAFDRILLSAAEIRSVAVSATGGPDSVRVIGEALVDDTRRGDFSALIDPHPERRSARIERFDIQLDRDRWVLAEPATFSFRDELALRSFLIRAGEQQIRIDGGLTDAGAVDLVLAVDSTDIGTLSDLVGLPGLDGWVRGEARLGGSRTALRGDVTVAGGVHRRGATPGPFRLEATLEPSQLAVEGTIESGGGGTLRVSGSGPMRGLRRAPTGSDGAGAAATANAQPDSISLRVQAEDFQIAWAAPFLDPAAVGELQGRLDGEITGTGTASAPVLSGSLRLRNGTIGFPELGVRWQDVRLDASGRDGVVAIDSARARSGSGDVRATGSIEVSEGLPVDLALRFNSFRAIRNRQYWSTLSGTLAVEGRVLAPEITGEVELESLDVYLDERVTAQGLEDVELTDEDLVMLRERFGVVPEQEDSGLSFVDRLTADLVVRLGRDSWLRKRSSPEMAVAFTGDVDVVLRPGEEPRVDGSVTTIPGRGFVEQFGRRFALEEGTVTFSGPASEASVDLEAVYTIPSRDNPDDAEATIILSIEGTQASLSLVLSSDPPMENADIVSYIATGRPATSALAFGDTGSEGGLVAAGTDLALEQITGVIEGAAARSVGLDVVEIRREGLREATLVAGKYVSPRLYVGFAQPITLREGDDLSLGGEGESEVEIELQAFRWLLLNVEGSGSALRLFLRGRYAY